MRSIHPEVKPMMGPLTPYSRRRHLEIPRMMLLSPGHSPPHVTTAAFTLVGSW